MSSSALVGIDRPANSVRWSLSHLVRVRVRVRGRVRVRVRVRVRWPLSHRRKPSASAAMPAEVLLSVRRPEVLHTWLGLGLGV
jgi:hypothetical protein